MLVLAIGDCTPAETGPEPDDWLTAAAVTSANRWMSWMATSPSRGRARDQDGESKDEVRQYCALLRVALLWKACTWSSVGGDSRIGVTLPA